MQLKSGTIESGMLEPGFWLYVVIVNEGSDRALYVGMTGDSSSPNAHSPIRRLGHHLGENTRNNALSKHLKARGIDRTAASFKVVAFKLDDPTKNSADHSRRYATVNACERLLAEGLSEIGEDVINTVNCQARPDRAVWKEVRGAFSEEFDGLERFDGNVATSEPVQKKDQASGCIRFEKEEQFLFTETPIVVRFGGKDHECDWSSRTGRLKVGSKLAGRFARGRGYLAVRSDEGHLRLKVASA